MQAIPLSFSIKIIPGVISSGGTALDLSGLMLSTSARVPMGTVQTFSLEADVASYFGDDSPEAAAAAIYYLGSDGASVLPSAMLFAQYNVAAVAAWLRGGPLALTLTQLKALTGVLDVVVDGVTHTSSALVLTAATSFSNAATIILAGFTTPAFTITYDSISGAFVVTSGTTGATSTMDFASGSIAASLGLTSAMGAVTSQGAIAATPGPFMDSIAEVEQDWVTYVTLFDPDGGSGNTLKEAFAAWGNAQDFRYVYSCWDTDLSPQTQSSATESLGAILNGNNTSGTALINTQSSDKAVFLAGAIASVNFSQKNGRTNFAYRTQTGLAADITSSPVASNLKANGYNFYGKFSANKNKFSYFWDGRITGPFKWIDSYIGQIYFNSQLQLALVTLEMSYPSIPYNAEGYGLVYSALADPIDEALKFGTIRKNVPLSASQAAQINAAAGAQIDTILTAEGWYLQILPATSQVRGDRDSPPCKLWYMDGQSINGIVLNSLNVQ